MPSYYNALGNNDQRPRGIQAGIKRGDIGGDIISGSAGEQVLKGAEDDDRLGAGSLRGLEEFLNSIFEGEYGGGSEREEEIFMLDPQEARDREDERRLAREEQARGSVPQPGSINPDDEFVYKILQPEMAPVTQTALPPRETIAVPSIDDEPFDPTASRGVPRSAVTGRPSGSLNQTVQSITGTPSERASTTGQARNDFISELLRSAFQTISPTLSHRLVGTPDPLAVPTDRVETDEEAKRAIENYRRGRPRPTGRLP